MVSVAAIDAAAVRSAAPAQLAAAIDPGPVAFSGAIGHRGTPDFSGDAETGQPDAGWQMTASAR
jgi:hypothetical protein